MPAAQNNQYELGDVALGKVGLSPPNSEYGQIALRPTQYDELQLKPSGTDDDDDDNDEEASDLSMKN